MREETADGGARGQVPQRTEEQIPGLAETQEDSNACQTPMNTEVRCDCPFSVPWSLLCARHCRW